MVNKPIKLYAFHPKGCGQYSFSVMAADERKANLAVEGYVAENFDSTCNLPYAGFGTDSYKLTILVRGSMEENRIFQVMREAFRSK